MSKTELIRLIRAAQKEHDPKKSEKLWNQIREALAGQFNFEDHTIPPEQIANSDSRKES